MDALPQRVFWKDRDLVYRGCNRAFARDAGLTEPAEIVGKTDFELCWSREESEQFRANDRAIIESGEPRHFIEPQHNASGLERWLDTRKQPLRDGDGRVVGVLGTYLEVAPSEQVEREAALARERLQLALSSGQAGLWDWNPQTDEAYFCARWTAMLGYERAEVPQAGRAFFALIVPADRARTREAVRRVFSGEVEQYEETFRMIHRDGSHVWVRARGRVIERDGDGRPTRMIGLHADVTDQKRTEEALREAEERFRRGFEQSGVPSYLCTLEGAITRTNSAYRRLLGGSDELVGGSVESFAHPDDAALCRDLFDAFTRGGESTASWEKRFVRADGTEVHAVVSNTLIRDAAGSPREVLVQIQDVTARKIAEAQLKQQEEALRHRGRMEAVGALAGGIAHEFNNLLQAIGGFTEFAGDGLSELEGLPGLPPAAADAAAAVRGDLEQVVSATGRAAELTRKMLDFSRRDGRVRQRLDAAEQLDDLSKLLRPLVGERMDLIVRPPARGAAALEADRTELQQCLLNLCVNARDAMADVGERAGAGGRSRLTVSAEPVALRNSAGGEATAAHADAGPGQGVTGGPVQPGAYVRFSVSDTGPGVPEELRRRIFDPFFTTKPPGRGTGLGLAAVYSLVEQQGGRVVLETGPDGSTFHLDLPAAGTVAGGAAAGETAGESAPDLPSADCQGKPRVLIAEDETLVREIAVQALNRAGYETVAVDRGDAAVAAFEEHGGRFALLLFDIVMPGLTGREAYERIRGLAPEGGSPPPVLFCTGHDPESDRAMNMEQCEGLPQVRKPITPAALVQAVRERLG
ncbi:PAS domain S-box protein [Alienimonas sp. DA493]|uniref:PAS domain-containing hybrid sensor histidine kinase/response regulator n=1 Tax=Alienimonas sp. DA493 TaxID=3373605 RepID=UPI003754EF8B